MEPLTIWCLSATGYYCSCCSFLLSAFEIKYWMWTNKQSNEFFDSAMSGLLINKAVYTACVAPSKSKNNWLPSIHPTDGPSDRRTDGPTDRRMDTPSLKSHFLATNKAHKANDASSWWHNDYMVTWLQEIILDLLRLWLIFTDVSLTDQWTDKPMDR